MNFDELCHIFRLHGHSCARNSLVKILQESLHLRCDLRYNGLVLSQRRNRRQQDEQRDRYTFHLIPRRASGLASDVELALSEVVSRILSPSCHVSSQKEVFSRREVRCWRDHEVI